MTCVPPNTLDQRARATDCLQARIEANIGSQKLDLTRWIFGSLPVAQGARVLELCCGTGAQSQAILEQVGPRGQLVAMDISQEAVNAVRDGCKPALRDRLVAIQGELEGIPEALEKNGIAPGFDLMFCAYGLYYSRDVRATLDACLKMLNPGGRIAVVGPHGSNNRPLYDLLEAAGVKIPAQVISSSVHFMRDEVLRWAEDTFWSVQLNMVENPVAWNSAETVLNYWRNSTFHDATREPAVKSALAAHFKTHGTFTNVKCIMLAIMSHAR